MCVPGGVWFIRGRGDEEVLQGTAVSPGRGAQGTGGRGHTAAGALRDDGL